MDFPSDSVVKNLPATAGDSSLILGSEYPLKKEMATHFSILAWEIPWAEKPDGLKFMGSQKRVGHDLTTKQQYMLYIYIYIHTCSLDTCIHTQTYSWISNYGCANQISVPSVFSMSFL